jgi:hypothetical protein
MQIVSIVLDISSSLLLLIIKKNNMIDSILIKFDIFIGVKFTKLNL